MERTILADCALWIPAFAGMTDVPCEDVYQFMHGSVKAAAPGVSAYGASQVFSSLSQVGPGTEQRVDQGKPEE